MAEDFMTYGQSQVVLNAIRVLEQLEKSGKITPNEQKALDAARSRAKTAEQAQIETAAGTRGMIAGSAFNLQDEIRGAYNAANEFLKSGDLKAAREKYAEYRDLQRQLDTALQVTAPEFYEKGRTSGQIGTTIIPAAGAVKIGEKLGKVAQMGIGATTSAAASALPEFGGGEGGFVERMSNVSPVSTAASAVVGGAAPVVGPIAGEVTRKFQDITRGGAGGYSGSALRRVGRALQRPQTAGQDIEEYLASLGPEGMVADIAGSPRSMAQGLATMQGEGADILRRNLEARAGGSGTRVQQTVTEALGPEDAAYAARQAEAQRKSTELGPLYDAALSSDKKFNVNALRSGIVMMSDEAAGDVRASLNKVLRNLGAEGEISATKLHNARSALSDAINLATRSGENNKVRQLMPLLDDMDNRLDEIKDYAKARTGYAESSAVERALENGQSVFSGGPTSALDPKELGAMLNKMKPAEVDAYKKGARQYIAALMGTSRSDAASAWAQFDKSWNREKLELLLGKQEADDVIKRLFAEKEFSGTRGDVLAGSQTSFREEARESLADIREPDSMQAPSPLKRAYEGLFNQPVNRMIDEVLYGSRRSNLNRQIGELLTMQGAERNMIVPVLLDEAKRLQDPTRAQAIVDALTQIGVITYGSTVGE